jgi:hypothetical protein
MTATLEQRVKSLEKQLAELRRHGKSDRSGGREWLGDLYGKFANDPIFEKAMKLGRQYRLSLRPGISKAKHKR